MTQEQKNQAAEVFQLLFARLRHDKALQQEVSKTISENVQKEQIEKFLMAFLDVGNFEPLLRSLHELLCFGLHIVAENRIYRSEADTEAAIRNAQISASQI